MYTIDFGVKYKECGINPYLQILNLFLVSSFCDIQVKVFLHFRMNMHFHNFSKKKSPKSFKVHQSYPALNDVTEKQIMVCYF